MNLIAIFTGIKHHTELHLLKLTQRRIHKISSNTDKKESMRATAKILGARASEHSFKFCEQSKLLMDHSSPLINVQLTHILFSDLHRHPTL